jgi:hypothetical protein
LIVQSLETEMLIGVERPLDKDMVMLRFWSAASDWGFIAALSKSPSSDEFVEADWAVVEEEDSAAVLLLDVVVDWIMLGLVVDSLVVDEVLTAK